MFLPGESQGRQGLVGCRLWGRTEVILLTCSQVHKVIIAFNPQKYAYSFLSYFPHRKIYIYIYVCLYECRSRYKVEHCCENYDSLKNNNSDSVTDIMGNQILKCLWQPKSKIDKLQA